MHRHANAEQVWAKVVLFVAAEGACMARVVGVYGDQVTHRKIGLGVWMDVLDEACKLVADGDLRRGVRGFTAANVKVGAYIYVAPFY